MISWDPQAALDRMDGNEELLHEVLKIILQETPATLAKLRVALADGKAELVERAAHSLKGELSYLGNLPLLEEIKALEQMGRKGDLTGAEARFTAVENDFLQLLGQIRAMFSNTETVGR